MVKETDEEIGLKLTMIKELNEFLKASKKLNESIGFIFEQFLCKNSLNNEWVGAGFILTKETELSFKDKEVIDFKWLIIQSSSACHI